MVLIYVWVYGCFLLMTVHVGLSLFQRYSGMWVRHVPEFQHSVCSLWAVSSLETFCFDIFRHSFCFGIFRHSLTSCCVFTHFDCLVRVWLTRKWVSQGIVFKLDFVLRSQWNVFRLGYVSLLAPLDTYRNIAVLHLAMLIVSNPGMFFIILSDLGGWSLRKPRSGEYLWWTCSGCQTWCWDRWTPCVSLCRCATCRSAMPGTFVLT